MKEDERIPTHVWVMAQVKSCNGRGKPAFIIQKGEKLSGLCLLRVNMLNGQSRLFSQQRDLDGRLGWIEVPKREAIADEEAEAYLERARKRDPDLWIVEVEDTRGVLAFEGPLHRF